MENIQEISLNDLQKMNMMEYYKEIFVHRSVADFRDGLKDVHRRLLFTCLENTKCNSSKPHVKSARIVGDCIGWYHPHGDTAAYDALVKLTQDWSNNVPLIDPHGNFGSIYGDSAAAMRYCLTGDMLLLKPNGSLVKMKDISDIEDDSEIEINGTCIDYKNETKEYNKFFSCGKFPIIEVVTNKGYLIKGSENHPLMTIDKNFKCEWKRLDELKVGDRVLINRKPIDLNNLEITEEEKINAINVGIETLNKHNEVPNEILNSNALIHRYFLSTLIENKEYQSNNKTLLNQLQVMLLVQGIESSVNENIIKIEENSEEVPNLKDYFFVNVKEINRLEEDNIYSVRVNSNDHSFIANGYINHNTEAKLNKFSEDVMLDKLKTCVNFRPNYDKSTEEPEVLPAKIPLILINGSYGIVSGYMASIPPHNFNEVIEETIKKLKDPEYKVKLYPDFPTGGICNIKDIENIYDLKSNNSNVIIRSKIDVMIENKKTYLRITEIPFMKTTDKLVESINSAVKDKKVMGIRNLENASRQNKIDIKLEIDTKNYEPETVKNQLFKYTICQFTLPISLLFVTGNENFKILSINDMLSRWIDFRIDTVKRIKMGYIRDWKLTLHKQEGLLKAYDIIDEIIKLIKKSNSKANAREMLMKKYKFSDIQANYILELELYKLNKIAKSEIENNINNLKSSIENELEYFKNPKKMKEYIINEMTEIKNKYGKKYKRRTKLEEIEGTINVDRVLPDSEHILILTDKGYLKKIDDIKEQKRGGKGISIGKLKVRDFPKKIMPINNLDRLLIFSESGLVFSKYAYEIDNCSLQSFGNQLKIGDEKISSIINISKKENEKDIGIVMVSKNNTIKITKLEEFKRISYNGIKAIVLPEGNKLLFAEKVDMTKDFSVFVANDNGISANINKETIPVLLRPTLGNLCLDKSTMKDSVLISANIVTEDTDFIFFITNSGLGKRVTMNEFPRQNRGGKGRIGIKLKDNILTRTLAVKEEDNLIVISKKHIMNIPVTEVPLSLRPAYGNRIKKLEEDDTIIDSCNI